MSDSNIFKHLKDNWIIYVCLATIIANFATNGSDIAAIKAKQVQGEEVHKLLQLKIDQQQVQYAEIQSRLASIDTSLQYLKER